MLKKYQTKTIRLSSKEMKEIKGGVALVKGTIFNCTDMGVPIVYCAAPGTDPNVCGHDGGCTTNGVICNPATFNGINCQ